VVVVHHLWLALKGSYKLMTQKKILIVDDAKTARLMAKMSVGRGAYQVITAQDGLEAVHKASSELPDLILMDVVMPVVDGFEATRMLRATAATKHIPVIMVTTRGEEVNIQRGYEVGCNAYLTKPFNPVELMAKIRHLIN
jgi:CheY-like chemotaxis protein